MLDHVVVCVSTELVAACVRFSFPPAVPLPGVARLVVAKPIELDGQPVRRPATVDSMRADTSVGFRKRESVCLQKLDKPALELAQCDAHLASQHSPQLRRAWNVRATREHFVHVSGGCPVKYAGLVTGPRQFARMESRREVDEGARDGSDRDPTEHHRVIGAGPTRASRNDPIDLSFGRRGDLRLRERALEDAQQVCGGETAEHRSVTTREHRREVARLDVVRSMPDAVHATMHGQQAPLAHAAAYHGRRHSCGKQLRARHNSVLVIRDARQFQFRRPG